jgi:hypothetical protein
MRPCKFDAGCGRITAGDDARHRELHVRKSCQNLVRHLQERGAWNPRNRLSFVKDDFGRYSCVDRRGIAACDAALE